MKNTFGNAISMTIFGESHGPAIGAVLDGLAAGLPVNEAAIAAVKDNRKVVSQRDMEEAIETVIAGYQRKNAVVSPRDKLTVSYHECGHALVAAKLKNAAPVQKITIIPRTSGALGYTMQVDEEERLLMTREQILDKITTFCARPSS